MSEIEKAILREFADFKIDSIENLGEGDFCRAFLVNENLVFRFAKHEKARRSLMRENCLLPKIADRLTLEIPLTRFASFAGDAANSFIAYRFLPGDELVCEKYFKLGEENRAICAAQIAAFLTELHSIEIESAEKCGVERVNYREKYSRLLSEIRAHFSNKLEKSEFAFAAAEVEKFLETSSGEVSAPVLLHGDLSPDHILFDGERVTAIIDFGDLMIGDRAWDFLWIYEDLSVDFFVRALDGYRIAEKKSIVERVTQFSKLEAIQWIAESAEHGESEFADAVEHLRAVRKKADEIKLFFDNPPGN